MFDSPIDYCGIHKTYVALDQTQRECAIGQRCDRTRANCRLAQFFSDREPALASGATAEPRYLRLLDDLPATVGHP